MPAFSNQDYISLALDVGRLILDHIRKGELAKAAAKVRAAEDEKLGADWHGRMELSHEIVLQINEWQKMRNAAAAELEKLKRRDCLFELETERMVLLFFDQTIKRLALKKKRLSR